MTKISFYCGSLYSDATILKLMKRTRYESFFICPFGFTAIFVTPYIRALVCVRNKPNTCQVK